MFLLSNSFGPNWVDNVESYMNSYANKRVVYWMWKLLISKIIHKLYTKLSQLRRLFFISILYCCKNSHSYVWFKATVLSWAKYSEVTQNYKCNYNHTGIFVITFVFRRCLSCCSFLSDNHSNQYLLKEALQLISLHQKRFILTWIKIYISTTKYFQEGWRA